MELQDRFRVDTCVCISVNALIEVPAELSFRAELLGGVGGALVSTVHSGSCQRPGVSALTAGMKPSDLPVNTALNKVPHHTRGRLGQVRKSNVTLLSFC